LTNSGGNVIAAAITGTDGKYEFSGLPPGSFTVTETNPQEYIDFGPSNVNVTLAPGNNKVINFVDTVPTATPTPPPTVPPTKLPTPSPMALPTAPPTKLPTPAPTPPPTPPPTKSPTPAPTPAPTAPPTKKNYSCTDATFNGATDNRTTYKTADSCTYLH
jgi:outer membrane biosynthesis protein TonB